MDESICKDLRASVENSFVSGKADEFLCVCADMTRGEVRILSSKKVS
jgi:hypothetical protein